MFDVKKHLIKVQGGRQYLPVAARLVWFREQHPDWGIETRPIAIDTEKQYAIFEALVYNAEGKLMAKGTKMENVRGFPDYIEKAETGSIGRALAVCGFGTQFAPDLDETTAGRIVDSPQFIGNRGGASYGDSYGRSRESSAGESRYGAEPRFGSGQNGNGRSSATDRPAPARDAAPVVTAVEKEPAAETEHDPFDDGEGLFEASSRPDGAKEPIDQDACSACGKALNAAQQTLSIRKYGVALCPTCQRERRAVEAG